MKVKRSVVIDAPIERVWAAIRRFDAVADWNAGVAKATLESGNATEVGAIRKLETADGAVFRETLLAHSDEEHCYSYNIVASPLPCTNYVACHRLVEITQGNKTLGIWEGEFECHPAQAEELEEIVGDRIYRDAQLSLNDYLRGQQS